MLPLMSSEGATAFYTILEVSSFGFQIAVLIPLATKVFYLCPYAEQALRIAPFSLGTCAFLPEPNPLLLVFLSVFSMSSDIMYLLISH